MCIDPTGVNIVAIVGAAAAGVVVEVGGVTK